MVLATETGLYDRYCSRCARVVRLTSRESRSTHTLGHPAFQRAKKYHDEGPQFLYIGLLRRYNLVSNLLATHTSTERKGDFSGNS